MATLNESSLQMRLEKRKGTISEVDRPLFEKQQTECIIKAIKNEETPAKEKHVRRAIIGTWQERGNSMFWMAIGKQPLPSQAVMCWKALTVMHKILREGHPNVLKDSYVYRKTLKDLFAVYKYQAGPFSTLISDYLKVLQVKIESHHKYPGLTGSLTYSAENPVKIPGRDINDVFTFGVETLDYQDNLLTLEDGIFNTLDKSKNNSNISSSQCKIAPLVPILKECAGMYDVLVQALTKLHKNLPPDTLDGLRQRFYDQHRKLKSFCLHAGAMLYITSLMTIPSIPDHPPDFLAIKYQPKVKREESKEEPKPIPVAQQVDERDILIEQLMKEISELREHLDVTISQGKQMEDHLRMEILRQKEEVKRMEAIARQVNDENVLLKQQLEMMKENESANDKAKDADEKFNKLKQLYGKLRQDHIDLLRKNAEIKQKEEAAIKLVAELQANIDQCKLDLAAMEKEKLELQEKYDILNLNNDKLKSGSEENENMANQIQSLQDEILLLSEKLAASENEVSSLKSELAATREASDKEMAAQIASLNEIICNLKKNIEELEDEKNRLRQELLDKQAELDKQILDLSQALELAQQSLAAEVKKSLDLEAMNKENETKLANLAADLQKLGLDKESEEERRKAKENELSELELSRLKLIEENESKRKADALNLKLALLSSTANECANLIQGTLELFSNPKHESGTTCSAEFLQTRLENLPCSIQNTTKILETFSDTKDDVSEVISNLMSVCHQINDSLIHGKATSHMTSPEDCITLVTSCQSVGESTLSYIHDFKNIYDIAALKDHGQSLHGNVEKMMEFVAELVLKQSDSSDVENVVEEEMHATEKLVEDAASRIEEMLNKSRKTYTGVQLEVNEKILETCTALMEAIRELILKSKYLQDEIVAEGRGTASVTEFYKRHHKWAEGLLSAAKAVGFGATVLVNAADKVIERKGKFEELIVASHDIAASTAQLVAASRVKASSRSTRLPPLMKASKNVGEATAGVVAAVRNGISLTEDSKTMPDYSKMTLTQAKRWEMDSQVKIIELEDKLGKERSRLGELRKAHYQIAVELYGEDQVKMD